MMDIEQRDVDYHGPGQKYARVAIPHRWMEKLGRPKSVILVQRRNGIMVVPADKSLTRTLKEAGE